MGQLSVALRVYVSAVALAALLFLVAATAISPPDTNGLIAILFFVALGAIADASRIALPRGGAMSAAFAVEFACIITQGTTVAVWVGWLGTALAFRRRPLHKVGFNAGESALTCGLSALAFQAAGGQFAAISSHGAPISHYWLALLAAGACYIVVNSLIVVTAVALERRTPLVGTWLAGFRWLMPQFCALAPFGVLIAMVYQVPQISQISSHRALGGHAATNIYVVRYLGVALFLMPLFWARYAFKGYMDMRRVHEETVDALTTALERYDPYTDEHSSKVERMAVSVASALGYPEHKMDALRFAARLHDIGKFVMEPVLHKKDKLSDADWALIKQHPEEGRKIVAAIEVEKDAAQIVLATHERPDGGGYPKGLSDSEISLAAKIIAVVDAFDAMTSDRPYRKALPLEVAISELRKGARTQFAPDVVEAAIRALPPMVSEATDKEPAGAPAS
jgi:putative nucleotidyltransferase with HDIG domain